MQTCLEQRLEEHPERLKCINHYIFTDSDIAVVGNLGHIFKKYHDFHLALTFRNNKDQPLNSGFIVVRGTSDGILRGKAFLKEVLEIYNTKYTKASRMLGDQLALAWVVKSHLTFATKKFSRSEAFSGRSFQRFEEAVNVGILELIQLILKLIRHAMPHLKKWKNQTFLEQRLEEHPERLKCINHYIFTDSDIAVVGNLGHIFKKYHDFHLALTFRNNKDQPLNSGFIAVKGTSDGILRAKAFLKEVLEIYSTKYTKASRMLGDQLALAWVVKSHLTFATKKFSRPEAFSGRSFQRFEEAVNVGILELIQLNLKLIRHAMPHLRKWKNQV
ncbi:hypothetical protein J5N97_025646 [Dioscorea zingiberensis]|uniref:Uncharacterized protein n=1 Tax=Dioscorea zingiberensis TaxID=325984 RepID=A0A9D5C1J2_9LILI|nr:hypothetical protein J5N97_025646 [Dioscorea zingiberensis]